MNKQLTKQKRLRHQERLNEKQVNQAAEVAIRCGIVITLQAIKDIFKDQATNQKCEDVVCKILKYWEDIGGKKVKIQTIADSVEVETGIRYELETGVIRNMEADE